VTPTMTPSATSTSIPTVTETPTVTDTATATPTMTATLTPSTTPSPTASSTPRATPSATLSPTAAVTLTATPAGITISKKVNTNVALPGQPVQYTIDVHSTVGGNGVQITQVLDALPPGFSFVAGTSRFQLCSPCASAGAQDPTITTSNGRAVLTWA